MMKRTIALLLTLTLLYSLAGVARAEGTDIRPRLPDTVTEYGMDSDTNAWKPVRTWHYTYENGYPVSVDLYEIDLNAHVVTTFQYVFENGLPVKRETYNGEGVLESVTEYLKGRVYNVYAENDVRKSALYYQYGNGDDYFTLVLRDDRSRDPELGGEMTDFAEEVDAVSVTVVNGLLKKTVNTGMYANWGGAEEKEWLRFSGTYTAEYDGDGIVSLISAVHRTGESGVDGRFEVTKADGAVTEGTVYYPEADGGWFCLARFSFAYTDLETTPARYAQMINSVLMGSENNYYNYNWY